MSKLKRNSMRATNRVDPAATTSKDFGYIVPGKGGKTLNSNIDPHAFDREKELITKDDYVPEHERYLSDGMDVIK